MLQCLECEASSLMGRKEALGNFQPGFRFSLFFRPDCAGNLLYPALAAKPLLGASGFLCAGAFQQADPAAIPGCRFDLAGQAGVWELWSGDNCTLQSLLRYLSVDAAMPE